MACATLKNTFKILAFITPSDCTHCLSWCKGVKYFQDHDCTIFVHVSVLFSILTNLNYFNVHSGKILHNVLKDILLCNWLLG